jgi:outer membrane biosynthesis protein TonB
MAKRPGHVEVVTEVGFCNFCNRSRNLRREEHHLGGLMRTIVSCETCHRTLSSTIGVATAEPEPEPEPAKVEESAVSAPEEKPKARRAPAKKPTGKKAPVKKPAAKPRTPPKPRTPGTRKSTRTK